MKPLDFYYLPSTNETVFEFSEQECPCIPSQVTHAIILDTKVEVVRTGHQEKLSDPKIPVSLIAIDGDRVTEFKKKLDELENT